jgi:hypothetical protein
MWRARLRSPVSRGSCSVWRPSFVHSCCATAVASPPFLSAPFYSLLVLW